jgi:hypothetical protein
MKKLLGTLLPLLCALAATAQVTLRGTVKDSLGNPIPDASIVAPGKKVSSNAHGAFTIVVDSLPVNLRAAHLKYVARSIRVVKAGAPLYFRLAPRKSAGEVYKFKNTTSAETYADVAAAPSFYNTYASSAPPARSRTTTAASSASISYSWSSSPKTEARTREDRLMKTPKKSTNTGSLLTAGELSDFKKWKLWSDYTPETFSISKDQWGLLFRQRYCVQVKTATHQPIVGEPVYLLDKSGDTLWSAISDNTGKAELWGREDGETATAGTELLCGGRRQRAAAFTEGINLFVHQRDCRSSDNVDIAFVVDATGSMSDEIRFLQDELGTIIGRLREKHRGINLRTASVFYRDKEDDYLTRQLDFSEKTEPLLDFIKKQEAGGGGDFPEAVDAALSKAIDGLHWSSSARAKLLFLVLDAPPHDDAKARMKRLVRRAAAQGIRIIPVVCSGIDKPTEYLMRCLALATNGTYVFLTDDSGIGDTHLKPTTDDFKVELLTDLIVRLVNEMVYIAPCSGAAPEAPVVPGQHPVTVTIFPNPARDYVELRATESIKEIYLTDFTGKVLQRINTGSKGNWRIELRGYPAGTYLLRYLVEGKGWGSEKVLLAP